MKNDPFLNILDFIANFVKADKDNRCTISFNDDCNSGEIRLIGSFNNLVDDLISAIEKDKAVYSLFPESIEYFAQ